MIPSDWLSTHADRYRGQYDFSLPADRWSGEQKRDFTEFMVVASGHIPENDYVIDPQAAYRGLEMLGIPFARAMEVLPMTGLIEVYKLQQAEKNAPPTPPPPPAPRVQREERPKKPLWKRLLGV